MMTNQQLNYTILTQKICHGYERVDALDAYTIDFSERAILGDGYKTWPEKKVFSTNRMELGHSQILSMSIQSH